MHEILHQYGYALVFLGVLAENVGLPVPSYALVLVASSMAAEMHFTFVRLVAIGIVAALLGDTLWYCLGRVQGRPILRTLCSISLNPDSCVSRTEDLFGRHGLKSLLVAKFLPGLNTVAPPLAGMLKISPLRFALFDFAGAMIWAISGVAVGWVFRYEVMWLLAWLEAVGRMGLVVLAVLLAGWILWKWVERRQFYRLLERSRISPPELKVMLERGDPLVIVDLRSELTYQVDGVKIRGAIHIAPGAFEKRYKEVPPGRPVVMYCT